MDFGSYNTPGKNAPSSEINMVPLIDVMLVLLIVFMITAPLMTHSVEIDLPQASSEPEEKRPETINLAIDGKGALYWNDLPIDSNTLDVRLEEAAAQKPKQPELHLRADRQTRYQVIAEVLSRAKVSGLQTIGFVTSPEEAEEAPAKGG